MKYSHPEDYYGFASSTVKGREGKITERKEPKVTERCVKFFNLKSMRPKERERWQEIRGRFWRFPTLFCQGHKLPYMTFFFYIIKKKKKEDGNCIEMFFKKQKT